MSTFAFRRICEGVKDSLSSKHGTLHGSVSALHLGHIHEPWTAAHQAAPWECQLWQALQYQGKNQMVSFHLEFFSVRSIYAKGYATEHYILKFKT